MVSRVSSDDCERCFTAEDSVISEKHRENKVCPSKSDINPAGCLAASSTAKQTGDHQPLNLDWSILTNPRLLRRPVKLSPPASSRNCLIGVGWMVDGWWKGRWSGGGVLQDPALSHHAGMVATQRGTLTDTAAADGVLPASAGRLRVAQRRKNTHGSRQAP